MRLVHPDKLLSVLSIPTSSNGVTMAGDALDACFSAVEEMLETSLVRATTKDTFQPAATAYRPSLRLTHGFLTKGTVSVTVDSMDVPDTLLVIDRLTGVITLQVSRVDAGSTIEVLYEHGYTHAQPVPPTEGDVDPEDPDAPQTPAVPVAIDTELLVDIPPGLAELHLLLGASLMQSSPSNMPKDKAKTVGINAARNYENKARILSQRYARPRGACLWAIASEAM